MGRQERNSRNSSSDFAFILDMNMWSCYFWAWLKTQESGSSWVVPKMEVLRLLAWLRMMIWARSVEGPLCMYLKRQWYDSVWVWRLENQGSPWFKSQSKGQRRCNISAQISEMGKKWWIPSFSTFCFCSGPQQILWCSLTLGRAVYVAKSTNSNGNLI